MIEPEMVKRQRATTATKSEFQGSAFAWRKCKTCLHLAWFQAKGMGHKVPRLPAYKNALTAKKALKARGFDSVTEALDSLFERIPPAEMRLGDLAAADGVEGLDAVFVNIAPRKMMGWREDAPTLVVLDVNLNELKAAWRL